MTEGYGSHADFMREVQAEAEERSNEVARLLLAAFHGAVEVEETRVIRFDRLSLGQLAQGIHKHPRVLKALLLATNIAARAVERDLGLKNLDTYEPRIDLRQAELLSAYLRPFLPPVLSLDALCLLDRTAFIDKEVRKRKGRWEKQVREALSQAGGRPFIKRRFSVGGQVFELDAAWPGRGAVRLAVDIKRIEARRDIHKRCDEIVNKARKLKEKFPAVKFAAFMYYPFVEEHANVRDRLEAPEIHSVVFAGESTDSLERAATLLLDKCAGARG